MTPDQMARIHAQCFSTPRPWSTAEFAHLLDSPFGFISLSNHGFALGRAVVGEAELLTIAVAPAFQGQGIGARLMDEFMGIARLRHAEQVFLEVAADNAAAIRLYHKKGFVQVGKRPNYYRRPDGTAITALNFARAL